MTRTPCRRRPGDALLRAEKCGDLVTAEHKVLNEVGGAHGECAAQRRLSKDEEDMDKRNWEQRSSEIALHETIRKLESQRLQLYQVNEWFFRLKEKD